ncbi:MAG: DUF305 domain-containing protein [Pseudonocardiaceae bacterium]
MQPEHALVPGMMSDQQMRQFTATGGTGFDRMFLQMMIAHHQGAVTISQTELAQGSNPVVVGSPRSSGRVTTGTMKVKLPNTSYQRDLCRRLTGMSTLSRPGVPPCSEFQLSRARCRAASRRSLTVVPGSALEVRVAVGAVSRRR